MLEWAGAGIYAITNTTTGEQYVGSAHGFAERLGDHLAMLRLGKHHCAKLQAAWNEYGANAFTFDVLERVQDATTLLEREQAWLIHLQPVYNGRLEIWSRKVLRTPKAHPIRPIRVAPPPRVKPSLSLTSTRCTLPYLVWWRAEKGVTQCELAEQSKVARTTIACAEVGELVNQDTPEKSAKALGISVHDLRHRNPEREQPESER
jgi:hypothetical protein